MSVKRCRIKSILSDYNNGHLSDGEFVGLIELVYEKECESLRKENERLLGFLNKVKKELHGDNDDYFICLNIDVLLGELFGDVQPLPPPPHKGGCE